MLCPIKVDSNSIELTVHTPCYCVLDFLCVIIFKEKRLFNKNTKKAIKIFAKRTTLEHILKRHLSWVHIKGLKLQRNYNWTGNWTSKLRRRGIPLPLLPLRRGKQRNCGAAVDEDYPSIVYPSARRYLCHQFLQYFILYQL